jgi:diguanylate cyclase (GGDEF)-like protein/PAS domain S-box-containing protein
LSIRDRLRQGTKKILRSTRLCVFAGLVMTCGVLATFISLERYSAASFRGELKDLALNVADVIHKRIVTGISQDISTLRALAHSATVVSNDPMERFGNFAEHHLGEKDHFVSIGIAPDYQLTNIYPSQWVSDISRDSVRASMENRLSEMRQNGAMQSLLQEPVMTSADDGTLTLVVPIIDDSGAEKKNRGAILLIIDQNRFLEKANAHPDTAVDGIARNIRFAIGRKDAAQPFVGAPSIADAEPTRKTIALAGDSWEILAAPENGWDALPENHQNLQTTLAVAAFSMVLPILIASVLVAERNRNIEALRTRESKLQELSQRFKLAMDSSNIGIWEIDADADHVYWDERASSLHGLPSLEKDLHVDEWLLTILPEDRAAFEAFIFNCTCGMQTFSEVYRFRMANGDVRHIRAAGSNHEKAAGGYHTTGIIWDVTADMLMAHTLRNANQTTEIKNAELELALQELFSREQELEELSGRLDLALESYKCGIWEADLRDNSAMWDERMHQLYGLPYRLGRVSREDWLGCLHPEDRQKAKVSADNSVAEDRALVAIQRIQLANGDLRYVRSVGQIHTGRDGVRKIVGIAFDISADVLLSEQLKAAKDEAEKKNAELESAKNRIEHNALHDPLTGLANRRKLDLELDDLSQDNGQSRKRFALLHLDLDRFKQINDTLGHAAGDAMLVYASRILVQNVREQDTVARIGGDEFVIVVREDSSPDYIKEIATRIITAFKQPLDFQGFSCRCGVSIGIAFAEGRKIDARKTLINADLALYRAKGMGRNRYEFFTQNLQAEILSNKRTGDEILHSLENGEFETWYQPQFSANRRHLTGVEALVRWRHPTRGLLTPDQFLRIAEELNVMATLDKLVLETALQDKRLWNLKGIHVPKVSVNVSSRRLNDENLIASLKELHIVPGEVSFELVESIFLDDSEAIATANLEGIKALGIDIEIDDFGTGHTSIVSLLKVKPKRLKIDRQLVMPILTSPQERSLVRSIIDIARSLGVETVAEGVETLDHATLLDQLGCDLLQGYAFSKPVSAEDFSKLAASPEWRMVS